MHHSTHSTTSRHFAQRLALWAGGTLLPEAYVLRPYIDAFRKGIMAAVISGFMISLGAAIGLYALFTYLVSAGLPEAGAMSIIAGFALLLAALAYSACLRWMTAASHVKQSLKLFPHAPTSAGDALLETGRAALNGFLDGLKPQPGSASDVNAAVQHFEQEMDRLVREIEALEKAAAEEDAAKARAKAAYDETVHELYPGGRPPHGKL